MAATELVKNIDEMRELLRDVYVNGFKNKDELNGTKASMKDKNLKRLSSWLGEYFQFYDNNKRVHQVVIDSRDIASNPLYNAYKSKSYNKAESIGFHFHLMEYLSDGEWKTLFDITLDTYAAMNKSEDSEKRSNATRVILDNYVEIGLLERKREERTYYYRLASCDVDLFEWENAISFFTESAPVGVIGSFLTDKSDIDNTDAFRYKHLYLLHALESHIMYDALDAIHDHKKCNIEYTKNANVDYVLPLKVFISTQRGSEHLLAYSYENNDFKFIRLSNISNINITDDVENGYQIYVGRYEKFAKNMWGVHYGENGKHEHVELTIRVADGEDFIIKRLEREKRNGSIVAISSNLYKYETDTYDIKEMFPWLRTFIGRIESFTCTNKKLEDQFWNDIDEMKEMYKDE